MSYRFEYDETLPDYQVSDSWHGEVIDSDGYVVAEVWNNDDGGGNFYLWHDATQAYGIEADAIARFASKAPMDDWINELQNFLDSSKESSAQPDGKSSMQTDGSKKEQ
jgi:hypothetical protein